MRASVEWRSRETRETRVSPLQSRAWSFVCLRRFAQRTNKKERLLVVYLLIRHEAFHAKCLQSYRMLHPKIWVKLPRKNAKRPRLSLKNSLLKPLLFLLFELPSLLTLSQVQNEQSPPLHSKDESAHRLLRVSPEWRLPTLLLLDRSDL